MDVFKVGEIVVGQNCTWLTQYNGMECEVIEPLAERWTNHNGNFGFRVTYRVRWANGDVNTPLPTQLRRRKPPTTGEESVLAMFKPTTKREGAPA